MKAKPKYPGPLVVVEWEDSCSPSGHWHDFSYAKFYETSLCVSVGWIMRRDSEVIVLIAGYSEDQVHKPFAIPAGCVKRVRRVKVPA
ncbi:MAG: hypothetical protein NUV72_07180 [Bauldia sp.]|nr:hypothetical protein [Bauldia sp.]